MFGLSGCVSKQKKEVVPPTVAAVQWETKAQVRDFKNNQTNTISIDIIALKFSQLRMEVSALLGYPVASFVSSSREVRTAIYTQKKFYFGANSAESLKPLLGFSLDPNILHNIIFDQPIRGWNCEMSSGGLVSLCKKKVARGHLIIAWPDRKEGTKRVIIRGPQVEMDWQFRSQTALTQIKAETFKLDAPSGYKIIQL